MSYYDYQVTARYVQCENALNEIKRYTYGLGSRIMVITACGAITEQVTNTIKNSYQSSMESSLLAGITEENPRYNRQIAEAKRFDAIDQDDVSLEFLDMEGKEVTDKTLRTLAELATEKNIDFIIGVGGGKGLDFARGTAFYSNKKCVLVPTSPSTNAAATQLCIVNGEDGKFQEGCLFLANYPSLVLADTSILKNTPPAVLAAGIADQVCSYYECLYSAKRLNAWNAHSELIWKIVRDSIDILRKYGKGAVEAAEKHKVTREYEMILSAILHNNGLARAVSGSGFSHLLGKIFVKFPECSRKTSHGLMVGYGIIPMMLEEGEPRETIIAYLDYCKEIGIPMTLESIGMGTISKEALLNACNEVCKSPSDELPFTGQQVFDCVFEAEEIVKEYLEGK